MILILKNISCSWRHICIMWNNVNSEGLLCPSSTSSHVHFDPWPWQWYYNDKWVGRIIMLLKSLSVSAEKEFKVAKRPFPILALACCGKWEKEWSRLYLFQNHFLFPFNFIFYLLVFCGLFVQPHLADVVWTELHMLVCSTETLDRRILPKQVKVVLEKKQLNTIEKCQKLKGNDTFWAAAFTFV